MYQLIFDEGGLSGLLTPQDDADAAVLAERYQFLRRIAPALQDFHQQIQKVREEANDEPQ